VCGTHEKQQGFVSRNGFGCFFSHELFIMNFISVWKRVFGLDFSQLDLWSIGISKKDLVQRGKDNISLKKLFDRNLIKM
jgi:hypothetical protein